jgi:hypothetical protein
MEKEKDLLIKIEDKYRECMRDSIGQRVEAKRNTPCGFVEIYEINEDGSQKLVGKSNLVVYLGREWLATRIFGTDNTSVDPVHTEWICWFGLGTGGVLPADPFDPVPPTNSDTDLDTPVGINATDATCADFHDGFYFKHPLDSVKLEQDPDNDDKYLIARAEITISNDDANGNNLSEAGLFTASSSSGGYSGPFHMYARCTFPSITKVETRQLLFVWYIYV